MSVKIILSARAVDGELAENFMSQLPLSAMEINTKDFWQSAAVYLYYPHELGRNDS